MGRINPEYHQSRSQLQKELEMINHAKNDPAKFEPIYKKYHEQIFRYVYQRSGNKQIASDIVSQVFMKAITKLNQYSFRGLPFSSWLYRIASNELNQWFRDHKAQRSVNVPMEFFKTDIEDNPGDDEANDYKEMLVSALRALDNDKLELIEYRYFEKRSIKEIAEILDISETNAKVRCHRALNKLKEIFRLKQKTYGQV